MKTLPQLKTMIDAGQYLNIHTPGLLSVLVQALETDYAAIRLNLQGVPVPDLQSESAFVRSLCSLILQASDIPENIAALFQAYTERPCNLGELFSTFRRWCAQSPTPIVLILEGFDAATEHQPFLDFLAMLRAGYIRREAEDAPTFHSVILAGETNLHNLETVSRRKGLRCIPWNIAVDVDLKN